MTWELLFENWYKIIALVMLLASLVISPIVLIRKVRTKNELDEMQTFIKKNRVIEEEMARLNNKMDELTKRIRALENELHDEKINNKKLNEELEACKKKLAQCKERKTK